MCVNKQNLVLAVRNQGGFSLVELVMAAIVLGILVSVAAPAYTKFIANSQIRTTAESINNGILTARAEAIKRNAPVKFTVNADTSWQVGCVTVDASTCPAVIQLKPAKEGATGAINLTITGANNITFTSLGTVSTTPGQLQSVEIDHSGMSAAETRELRVVLNGSSVKMCDPNIAATTDTRHCA